MLDAFAQGGDFHSRTAIGMYPDVASAVNRGDVRICAIQFSADLSNSLLTLFFKVLLEWDKSKGEAPKPLLKDAFSVQRRRAKTLNFSIAYGKTVHGLAKDWNVSTKEAKETLERWYKDRPEVKAWQEETIANAHRTGTTHNALFGQRRYLTRVIRLHTNFDGKIQRTS